MLVAIIVIIIVFGLVAAAAIIALKLLAGVIKAIALFTTPGFCMILGLAMNTNKVMIVESKFLNWLIWTLIFYAVIFVLCGFPKVNRAFDAMTSMLVILILAGLIFALLFGLANLIFKDNAVLTFMAESSTVLACAYVASFIAPFALYRARKNYTLHTQEHVGTETVKTGLISSTDVDIYEDKEISMDLTKHFFTFGDVWPVFQRILASFIYAIYPALVTTAIIHNDADWIGWTVFIITYAVYTAAAYFIQLILEKRTAGRAGRQNQDDTDTPAAE